MSNQNSSTIRNTETNNIEQQLLLKLAAINVKVTFYNCPTQKKNKKKIINQTKFHQWLDKNPDPNRIVTYYMSLPNSKELENDLVVIFQWHSSTKPKLHVTR